MIFSEKCFSLGVMFLTLKIAIRSCSFLLSSQLAAHGYLRSTCCMREHEDLSFEWIFGWDPLGIFLRLMTSSVAAPY